MSRVLLSFPGTPVAAAFDLWQDDKSSVRGATLLQPGQRPPVFPLLLHLWVKHKGNNELLLQMICCPPGRAWLDGRQNPKRMGVRMDSLDSTARLGHQKDKAFS